MPIRLHVRHLPTLFSANALTCPTFADTVQCQYAYLADICRHCSVPIRLPGRHLPTLLSANALTWPTFADTVGCQYAEGAFFYPLAMNFGVSIELKEIICKHIS